MAYIPFLIDIGNSHKKAPWENDKADGERIPGGLNPTPRTKGHWRKLRVGEVKRTSVVCSVPENKEVALYELSSCVCVCVCVIEMKGKKKRP